MLGVFHAEEGHVGLQPGEQLGDHGGNTLEVARPELALHRGGHRRDRHPGFITVRVHRGIVRREHHVDPGLGRQAQIPLAVPRVFGQIRRIAELKAVHVEAHDDEIAGVPRSFQERDVALVEEAHGGHETNPARRVETPGLVEVSGHLHRSTPTTSSNSPLLPLKAARAATSWR